MIKSASKPLLVLAAGAVAAAGIGGYVWHESKRPHLLEVYVFDTPGVPAIFIRTPDDRRILIDGGANSEVVKHITDILPFYSRRIDMIIATEADGQHVTGLIDVLDRYSVGEVVIPAITLVSLGLASSSDPIYEVFSQTIDAHKVPVQEVSAGMRLPLDEHVNAGILFPAPADQFAYSRASSPEILMNVSYGTTSVVLMGNGSLKVQKYIASENTMPTDALVFSHSAITANVSGELLESFTPEYLIYSQSLTPRSGGSASKAPTKAKADPLAGIMGDQRFNIQETGGVKLSSDGLSLKAELLR